MDNDSDVEYSKDATIHAFAIDTIGYGTTYKFTIDQIGLRDTALIYNADSLPVHADTIIDRILVKTFTTASGVVTMKTQDGKNDSLISMADSMDLRKPLKVTVWSTEAYAGISNIKKNYRIEVRVHKHDPDSLRWNNLNAGIDNSMDGNQQSVLYHNNILTYGLAGGNLKVYTASVNAPATWTGNGIVMAGGNIVTTKVTSLVVFKDVLYATFEGNNQGYTSTDGLTWTPSSLTGAVRFLAPIPNADGTADAKLSYLKAGAANGGYTFETSENGTSEDYAGAEKEGLSAEEFQQFPGSITSYTNFKRPNGTKGTMLIGDDAPMPTLVGDSLVSLPWAYDEDKNDQGQAITRWVPLQPGSTLSYCPQMNHPTLIYYNDKFYLFGSGFEGAYISTSGRDWKKDPKFGFPQYAWGDQTVASTPVPEFRGRHYYSMVQNPANGYLIFMFGKEDVSFKETVTDPEDKTRSIVVREYKHDSEVWTARLNQIWFNVAKGIPVN
ncbi:MAG: DUF6242 domain-containing protein [Mediterranea sp.]|nr:DUF6242 domain-containing protein [Mediterranea sp.]